MKGGRECCNTPIAVFGKIPIGTSQPPDISAPDPSPISPFTPASHTMIWFQNRRDDRFGGITGFLTWTLKQRTEVSPSWAPKKKPWRVLRIPERTPGNRLQSWHFNKPRFRRCPNKISRAPKKKKKRHSGDNFTTGHDFAVTSAESSEKNSIEDGSFAVRTKKRIRIHIKRYKWKRLNTREKR